MPEKLLTLTCMYVRELRCTFTKSDLKPHQITLWLYFFSPGGSTVGIARWSVHSERS